jgi:hypothetical protein
LCTTGIRRSVWREGRYFESTQVLEVSGVDERLVVSCGEMLLSSD